MQKKERAHSAPFNKGIGFTLIEVLITLAILAILMALVIVAINPLQHFKDANNAQRRNDLKNIMDGIDQNIIANKGKWVCPGYDFPNVARTISSADYNICLCLVPDYLAFIPTDPNKGSLDDPPCTTYDTKYTIVYDSASQRITLNAPEAEDETINLTR